jgi:thiamine pyrophosphate-dependent acetolactate synthase large subunit-like protein
MSQTVAGALVGVLEKIGIRQIFGLIGDSLNPIADAVRHSKIEWIGVRHEEGAALAAAGQAKQSSPVGSASVAKPPGPAAPISSPVSVKRAVTTRRFSLSPEKLLQQAAARA